MCPQHYNIALHECNSCMCLFFSANTNPPMLLSWQKQNVSIFNHIQQHDFFHYFVLHFSSRSHIFFPAGLLPQQQGNRWTAMPQQQRYVHTRSPIPTAPGRSISILISISIIYQRVSTLVEQTSGMLPFLCHDHKNIDAYCVLFHQSCVLRVLSVLPVLHVLDRVYCPARCRNQPSYWAPVVGNSIYADVSTHWAPLP